MKIGMYHKKSTGMHEQISPRQVLMVLLDIIICYFLYTTISLEEIYLLDILKTVLAVVQDSWDFT